MKIPANLYLYAVKSRDGRFITDRIGIGNWAKRVQDIEMWDSLTEAETFANYLNENTRGLMFPYGPYTVVKFAIQLSEF